MGEKTSYRPGQFNWVDLQTTDVEGAKSFYGELLGWSARDMSAPGAPYARFEREGKSVAGLGPLLPAMQAAGVPPHWSSYVCVDELEPVVERVTAAGGQVLMPPMKVMDQGSMAVIRDPGGAPLRLWQPGAHAGAQWVNDVGGFCWNELYTPDVEVAREFYERVFGWSFSVSAGASGDYWSIKNEGQPNGGMMAIRPEWGDVHPQWTVYFTVASCSQGLERATALGASVFMPPTEAPDTGIFAGLSDPQGATFMIIEIP